LLGRHYAPSQLKLVLDDFDKTETYEVKEIIYYKTYEYDPENILYLVKWKNYPDPKWDKWKPESSYIERQCIKDYWEKHNANKAEVLTTTAPERIINPSDSNKLTASSRGTKRKRAH